MAAPSLSLIERLKQAAANRGGGPAPAPQQPAPTQQSQLVTDKYPETAGVVSGGLQGGQSLSQILQQLLGGFTGSRQSLAKQPGLYAPFLAGALEGQDPFKFLQDFRNVENPMQAYGAGAGMIGQGAAQGLQGASNRLARAGLGRSSALAGLASQSAQSTANQQSNLFTNLFQAQQQRQAQNAMSAFDLHRQIAQMALGQSLAPRDGGQGVSSGMAALSGGLAGAGSLAPLGPFGAAAGGVLGALGGLFS